MELSRRHFLLGAISAGALGAVELVGVPQAAAAGPLLRYGSRGAAVRNLQSRLTSLGYWCGSVDGVFGNLTRQAVYAIQKAAGVSVDGVVGPVTWGKLDAGVRPGKRTTSGTAIEINKSRQLCMIISDGSLRYTLNTSTGSGERYYSESLGKYTTARTPEGEFSVYKRYSAGWKEGPLGSMYRPAYFTGGYAVHGSTSVPRYPASHGCVRVSTSAMDMLWAGGWVPVGRKVWVY